MQQRQAADALQIDLDNAHKFQKDTAKLASLKEEIIAAQ